MRQVIVALVGVGLVLIALVAWNYYGIVKPTTVSTTMRITSPAFAEKALIPSQYTCDAEEVSPPLEFVDVPDQAKSLVLIMDDPDAPVGTWDHWVVFNIPPQTRQLKEGEPPPGILGAGTSGEAAYQGPCPPTGEHRYFFKLYALDTMLKLSAGASKQEVERVMQNHILSEAELVGRYAR